MCEFSAVFTRHSPCCFKSKHEVVCVLIRCHAGAMNDDSKANAEASQLKSQRQDSCLWLAGITTTSVDKSVLWSDPSPTICIDATSTVSVPVARKPNDLAMLQSSIGADRAGTQMRFKKQSRPRWPIRPNSSCFFCQCLQHVLSYAPADGATH